MPTYFHKKTRIPLTAENEEQYNSMKDVFPLFTGGKNSEAHRIYTENILKTIAENKPEDNEDEKDVMAKSDELGFHIYCQIEHEDEHNRVWFVFDEHFPDEDTYNEGCAWRISKNIFKDSADDDIADTIVEINSSADFHKPYKT